MLKIFIYEVSKARSKKEIIINEDSNTQDRSYNTTKEDKESKTYYVLDTTANSSKI